MTWSHFKLATTSNVNVVVAVAVVVHGEDRLGNGERIAALVLI